MSMAAFDLHIHSHYSFDSLSRPEDIVERAIKKGLSGIAVTDHDSIKGGLDAHEYASKYRPDFTVIVGAEINTSMGEIIGLFLKEEVHSREPKEVIEEIRRQGGITVLPHPFKRGKIAWHPELVSELDCIEVFNARTYIRYNRNATRLCLEFGKSPTGGSDAHLLSEIGKGVTLVENSFTTMEELKQSILDGSSVKGSTSMPFVEVLSQCIKFMKTKRTEVIKNNLRRTYNLSFLIALSLLKGEYSTYWGKFDYEKEKGRLYREDAEKLL